MIFDAPLSPLGERQLEGLRLHTQRSGLDDDVELVVTTPLTRAIQTAMGGFDVERLRERGVPMIASALHVEVCDTACDIGRPMDELCREFPLVRWSDSFGLDGAPLGQVDEREAEQVDEPELARQSFGPLLAEAGPGQVAHQTGLAQVADGGGTGSWWYGGEDNPSRRSEIEGRPWCSGSWSCRRISWCPCRSMVLTEPQEEVDARILRFKGWLDARPESCIVVVGHSSFFQRTIEVLARTTMPKLDNCEVLDCQVRIIQHVSYSALRLPPSFTRSHC
jgi:broad specificity phosphatase PhoE